MKVEIISNNNPDWILVCTLIKETETKYFVWSNKNKTIEMHFPKHLYTMNKIDNTDV
jgi:hypothetical protein